MRSQQGTAGRGLRRLAIILVLLAAALGGWLKASGTLSWEALGLFLFFAFLGCALLYGLGEAIGLLQGIRDLAYENDTPDTPENELPAL